LPGELVQRTPTSAPRLILLLALALFISYVDRGNIATAAPLIEQQLHLSASQLGILLSAFFITYVLIMIPAGWLAERYGARRVLAVGIAIWSAATLLTGFVSSFPILIVLRLMLGVGESATFPCLSKLIASGVESHRVGVANGVVSFGYLFGPAVGTLAGGYLMAYWGWRPVFILFGTLSLVWLWPWSRVVVHEPQVTKHSHAGPKFVEILKQRGLWGTSLGNFSENYTFYFILTWLPEYLVKARGFSLQTMATVASTAYLINAAAAFVGGWISDVWIRSGRPANVIYKAIMALNHIAAIGCMVGMVTLPVRPSIACLFFYEAMMGLAAPGTFAIAQTIAGPSASARWVGVQNMCGNLAGIFAPAITGFLVNTSGRFETAFWLAGVVNVLGILGWVFMLPKIIPIRWSEQTDEVSMELRSSRDSASTP
jgi:MFS family permease